MAGKHRWTAHQAVVGTVRPGLVGRETVWYRHTEFTARTRGIPWEQIGISVRQDRP